MNLNLNRLTLSFNAKQLNLEKIFLKDYYTQSLPQLRKAIIFLTFLYLIFTISDKILDPRNFLLFASIRWLILAPFAVALYWATFQEWFKKLFQPLTSFGLLLGAFTTLFFIMKGNNEIAFSYYYSIYLILVCLFALFRIRFIWATPIGLLILLSYQSTLYLTTNLSENQLQLIFIFQGSFMILGSIVSYQLEYLTRKEFLAKYNLDIERQNLEQEVLQQTSNIEENYLNIRLVAREKAKLTKKLQKIQQIESVGLLAGGISHDFNNILTGILGYVTLATHQKSLPPMARTHFNDISTNANRATEITRQLLEFSKQQPIKSIILNPNVIIQNLSGTLKNILDSNICYKNNLQSDIDNVLVDEGQLERVITNLVVNAKDTMQNGGSLIISTFSTETSIFITVSDSGEGIPEEIQSRIFEPFFTTKDIGKGTGLGLATSFNIIKQFNGKLSVTSILNQGSTFQIELPAYKGQAVTEKKKPSSALILGKGQTILMVEDDPTVLEIGSEFLHMLNYYVIPASTPNEAIEIFNNVKIDLLFTDIIMPQMNGARLAEILKESNPDLPILYTSGYTSDILQKHGLDNLQISLLQKPYTPITLSENLNSLLSN